MAILNLKPKRNIYITIWFIFAISYPSNALLMIASATS